ncbi:MULTISPECIES: hypothetical protein [Hymenobacter]|uniref:Uncharacterized protein n=1 Tax=Hymenobacter profundi TaxID=1982110 RepID=A0ABS6X1E4_9BACT|nr:MULTISPECIES: hypothetical protein [Hymenobacter]MBW3129593.1 hypothetical protein [Hymenobacter profundi]QNE38065.1 hypothetical protein F1C16_00080 [Hymenobacter sp. NBH84]
MKAQYLFPHRFKKIGWLLFGISLPICLLMQYSILPTSGVASMPAILSDEGWFHFVRPDNNAFDFFGILLLLGTLLSACSAEKYEDEFIATLRLDSLLWATYVNYALLALALLLTYGSSFFMVMIYSMFSLPLLFLLRFQYVLYRNSHSFSHEK